MSAFSGIDRLDQIRIWDGVVAQAVEGERTTLSIIELDPGCAVPEHSHDNEQLGVLVSGSMRFRVGDEQRDVGPGDTWRIRPPSITTVVAPSILPLIESSKRPQCKAVTTGAVVPVAEAGAPGASAAIPAAGIPNIMAMAVDKAEGLMYIRFLTF